MKTSLRGSLWLTMSLLLLARSALGSVAYPAEVKAYFEVDSLVAPPPGCKLCHLNDEGGTDTSVQPFGRALVAAGAKGSDVASLGNALAQLEAISSDSDRDGVSDADELRMADDPNTGNGETPDPLAGVQLPQTGCAFSRRVEPAVTLAGAFALALLVLRRRRVSGD